MKRTVVLLFLIFACGRTIPHQDRLRLPEGFVERDEFEIAGGYLYVEGKRAPNENAYLGSIGVVPVHKTDPNAPVGSLTDGYCVGVGTGFAHQTKTVLDGTSLTSLPLLGQVCQVRAHDPERPTVATTYTIFHAKTGWWGAVCTVDTRDELAMKACSESLALQ
jgi:hypothetical protein